AAATWLRRSEDSARKGRKAKDDRPPAANKTTLSRRRLRDTRKGYGRSRTDAGNDLALGLAEEAHRGGRLGLTPDDEHAAAGARGRAPAPHRGRAHTHLRRHEVARLQRLDGRAEAPLRGGARTRLLLRRPRPLALPRQPLQPARRGRRGLPRDTLRDQGLQRSGAARGRLAT